jgi:hypothetical protein
MNESIKQIRIVEKKVTLFCNINSEISVVLRYY